MSPLQTAHDAKRTSAEGRRGARRRTAGFAGKCLLVSKEEAFIEGMQRAASGAGWDCASSDDPRDSLRRAFLHCFGLAIVDIAPTLHRQLLSDLFRILNGTSGGLVIAYDRRADPEAELWARQNGAWLYVPGVADWDSLSTACAEARRLHERKSKPDTLGAPV